MTGIWDDAGDVDYEKVPEGQPLPPAEAYRSIESVAPAREALAANKDVALQMIESTTESELLSKNAVAPWNPNPRVLSLRLLDIIRHFESHKSQLYYYLKLMDKSVNKGYLRGMG